MEMSGWDVSYWVRGFSAITLTMLVFLSVTATITLLYWVVSTTRVV